MEDKTPPVRSTKRQQASGDQGAAGAGNAVAAVAAVAAAALSAGGASFQITFNGVVYDVKGYAPDANGQYGFQVAKGGSVVAALTYKDDQNWRVQVGLPTQFKVDDHLTLDALNVDLKKGDTVALS